MKWFWLWFLCLFSCGCQQQPPLTRRAPPPYVPPPAVVPLPPPVKPEVEATDGTYEGTWVTTNRPLEGTMKCVVTGRGDKWGGRFYGVWNGMKFDYTVTWTGPPGDLKGVATIDGAHYDWTGQITGNTFKGKFGGDRYKGSFDLKR